MVNIETGPLPEAFGRADWPGLERNLFSSPDWLTAVKRTYRLKLFIKWIEKDGRVQSYIIYSVVDNFLERKICFCSYCDYFDCAVNSLTDWKLFWEELRREYPGHRIAIRSLRDPYIRQHPDCRVLSKEKFHLLDIRPPVDALWQNLHDSFRRGIKHSRSEGVTSRPMQRKELPQFYQMHLCLRKYKYRIFPQPYRFFENIWDVFMASQKGVLLGAYDRQGALIAATLYVICGRTLYYKFNTSRLEALSSRPNNLLFWDGLVYAKERGLEYLDFGCSGYAQQGLISFKEHTGAQPMDIVHLGFTPEGYQFSQKKILSVFTRVCTWPFFPDALTRWGSNIIYPFLA